MADNLTITDGTGVSRLVAAKDNSGVFEQRTIQRVSGLDVAAGNPLPVHEQAMPAAALLGDGLAVPATSQIGAAGLRYNGASLDLERGHEDGVAIATGDFTAGQVSPVLFNQHGFGALFFTRVNSSPAGETLQLRVDAVDPVGPGYPRELVSFPALPGSVVRIYAVCPGASELIDSTVVGGVQALPLGRRFRVVTVHSGSGVWNYSVSYSLLRA